MSTVIFKINSLLEGPMSKLPTATVLLIPTKGSNQLPHPQSKRTRREVLAFSFHPSAHVSLTTPSHLRTCADRWRPSRWQTSRWRGCSRPSSRQRRWLQQRGRQGRQDRPAQRPEAWTIGDCPSSPSTESIIASANSSARSASARNASGRRSSTLPWPQRRGRNQRCRLRRD